MANKSPKLMTHNEEEFKFAKNDCTLPALQMKAYPTCYIQLHKTNLKEILQELARYRKADQQKEKSKDHCLLLRNHRNSKTTK